MSTPQSQDSGSNAIPSRLGDVADQPLLVVVAALVAVAICAGQRRFCLAAKIKT